MSHEPHVKLKKKGQLTLLCFQVRFFGNVEWNEGKAYWWGGQEVVAKAYDVPIPGKLASRISRVCF